ncbi:MAG: Trk system potassium transporter TrkA [Clostridiales bacterium]|nr:Trk system potassium transporter TrkA [Clostridiales bacterium]
MKIVIVGNGKVGHALSEQLSMEGYDIVLIDNNPKKTRHSDTRLDIFSIQGNGASYNIQIEAGVPKADLLIAATSADELNILCCLLAKKLGAGGTIARVRNPAYYRQLGMMREELGLTMAINPEQAAAAEIARVLALPSVLQIETFARGRVELCQFLLPENTPLHGLPLAKIYSTHRMPVLVCAVLRDDEVFIPNGEFVLRRGDYISITAAPAVMADFCRLAGIVSRRVRSVMLAGGSRIAHYLTEKLLTADMDVKIIERNHERSLELCEQFPKATVVEGDACDYTLLEEEGLPDTDAFVALTGNDEENILMSLFAKKFRHPKVVAKLNREGMLSMADDLQIGTVVSPKQLTADHITQYVRALRNTEGNNVETLYRLMGNRVEALEFRIAPGFDRAGLPLKKLTFKPDLLVACIIRRGRPIFPRGDDAIEVGDSVIVITTHKYMQDVQDIFD